MTGFAVTPAMPLKMNGCVPPEMTGRLCDKTWDEPSRVTDRGAWGMALTKGRVMGEGCGGL